MAFCVFTDATCRSRLKEVEKEFTTNHPHYAETKNQSRTSSADSPVIVCRGSQVSTCSIQSWLSTLHAKVHADRSPVYCPQLSSMQSVLSWALHARCMSWWQNAHYDTRTPWGAFLRLIGKISLQRPHRAQPSYAWTYRFALVNRWRQTARCMIASSETYWSSLLSDQSDWWVDICIVKILTLVRTMLYSI